MQQMYTRLLDINAEAFAKAQFDVAYHALAAALHCAMTFVTDASLSEVETRATEQAQSIDALHSDYHHSTPSAAMRGNTSNFSSLARQAATRKVTLNMKQNKT